MAAVRSRRSRRMRSLRLRRPTVALEGGKKIAVVGIAGLKLDAEVGLVGPAAGRQRSVAAEIGSDRAVRVVVLADIGRAIVVGWVRVDRMGMAAGALIGIHYYIVVAASHRGRLSSSSRRQGR